MGPGRGAPPDPSEPRVPTGTPGPTDPSVPPDRRVPVAPDPVLMGVAAMVFVADPAAPVVEDPDVRHLLDVLRLRPGERVAVSDGAGRWAPCRVAADAPARGSRRADGTGLLVPDGPVGRVPPDGPRGDGGVRSHQGGPPGMGGPEADRVGGRPSRAPPDGPVGRPVGRRACRPPGGPVASGGPRGVGPEPSGVAPRGVRGVRSRGPGRPDRPRARSGRPRGWATRCRPPRDRGGARGRVGRGRARAIVPRSVGLGPTVLRAETAAVVAGALLCALRCSVVLPLA